MDTERQGITGSRSHHIRPTAIQFGIKTPGRDEMDIDQLREKLSEIKHKGYVVSLRRGNTGIGHTLETLFGVAENNLKTPDLDVIEIKSQRRETTNRVTMFTFNRSVWKMRQRELIERYG